MNDLIEALRSYIAKDDDVPPDLALEAVEEIERLRGELLWAGREVERTAKHIACALDEG